MESLNLKICYIVLEPLQIGIWVPTDVVRYSVISLFILFYFYLLFSC